MLLLKEVPHAVPTLHNLELLPDGKVKLKLKTPWHDGTSHLVLTPSEFLEKLAAIVPPPRAHLVKWSGVVAPNSPHLRKVILKLV